MQAPGTYVSVQSAAQAPTNNATTGTWFVTGEAEMGPVGVPIPITSMNDYANFLGGRSGYSTFFDSLDTYFREGGRLAYASRVVGPAAASATVTLKDTFATPANTLTLTANGPGVWGNSLTVTVAAGTVTNTYTLTIVNPTNGQTWVSPNLTSPADAVTWAQSELAAFPYSFPCSIANDASTTTPPANNPATGTFDFAAGADDLTDITETEWTTALTAFDPSLGAGQVSAPGHTTSAGYLALIAHAGAADSNGFFINNRFALLDDADSSSASTVASQVATAQSGTDPSFGMLLAPWVIVPGLSNAGVATVSPSTRTVPPSAFVAGRMAAVDASLNPGQPAAASFAPAQFAIGVTQTYSSNDRGMLDGAQVSVIRSINGVVQLYGYKTLALTSQFLPANYARMRMYIVGASQTIGASYDFAQIDGKGRAASKFQGDLSGMLQSLWSEGALYGASPADSFTVTVNLSPTLLAAGVLSAVEAVRLSPFANLVEIGVVAYPITQTLPASS